MQKRYKTNVLNLVDTFLVATPLYTVWHKNLARENKEKFMNKSLTNWIMGVEI